MHDRDDLQMIGRELVDDTVRSLVNLSERKLGKFVHRMPLRRVFCCPLYTLHNAGNDTSSLILRIPRYESPNRA